MSVDTIVAAGRAFSERMMTSTCHVSREIGQTLDPETLLYTEQVEPVWDGPCRIKFSLNSVRDRETEGQIDTTQQLQLFVPVAGTGTLTVNDIVTVTDGGYDPTLTGKQFRIIGEFAQTYATARRIPIEAVL